MNNRRLRHAVFHRWLWFHDIRFFNPHAMLFDLGGTAKRRNFSHVRAHRRQVHGSLALGGSKVHRFVRHLYILHFNRPEIVEARASGPQNERMRSTLG